MTISNKKRALSSDYGEKPKIKRSRNGCHNCKRLKIKCDENKPKCSYCIKTDTKCDYSMKLTWGGRPYKNGTKRNKPGYANGTNTFEGIKLELNSKDTVNDEIQFVVEGTNMNQVKTEPSNKWKILSTTTNSTMPVNGDLEKKPSPEAINGKSAKSNNYFDETELSKPSMLMNGLNSPPAFTTPSGDSILSDFNTFPQHQNFNSLSTRSPNQALNDLLNTNGNDSVSTDVVEKASKIETPREDSLNSIIDSIPEISTGIESLSNELERISNGGYLLNLKTSEILNNYMLSNLDESTEHPTDKASSINRFYNKDIPSTQNPWSPSSDLNIDISDFKASRPLSRLGIREEAFNNYSDDLAKIEAYLPERQKSNLLDDFLSSTNSVSLFAYNIGSSRKVREIEEDENVEESDQRLLHDIDTDLDFMSSIGIATKDPNKHILTPAEVFESIPPLLVPLPEILIEVPFYRNLMHFWVNVASQNLVPAPSYIYSDNPFKVLLPQMAMEYPSILTTLLAFAAIIRSLLLGPENIPTKIVDQLLARSCNELLKLLKDKHEATSDGTLATVLLLSCYESFQSNDFDRHRTHALGARQIVMARRCFLPCASPESDKSTPSSTSSNQNSRGKESDIAFFLMRWFIYVDVMGALSATKNSHKYLTSENGHYQPIESVANLTDFDNNALDIDRKSDIDHLLGFDIRVLPQLTDIALLIRKSDLYFEQTGNDCSTLPITIITTALEVKESITSAYEVGEARRQAKLDSIIDYKIQRKRETHRTDSPPNLNHIMQQYDILRATNKIFCDMGLLNLYRRVLCVPRESPIIQDLADGIGLILALTIESKSSAEICSIFALFCAGCETLDPNMRSLFYNRFTKLTEMGNVNAMKSLQIMSRCWATGEDWIVASRKLDIDVALL